jgi:hypothetical protein
MENKRMKTQTDEPDTVCPYCSKILSSKRNLTLHMHNCKQRISLLEKQHVDEIAQLQQQHIHEIAQLRQQHVDEMVQLTERHNEEQMKLRHQCDREIEQQIRQYHREIQNLKEQLFLLQSQIFEIAKQPTVVNHGNTTNNKNLTIINNMVPMLKQEDIQHILTEKYTEDDFYKSFSGQMNFIKQHIVKDPQGHQRIVCTDYARRQFQRLSDSGDELIYDPGASQFQLVLEVPWAKRQIELRDQLASKTQPQDIHTRTRINTHCYDNINVVSGQHFSKNMAKDLYVKKIENGIG